MIASEGNCMDNDKVMLTVEIFAIAIMMEHFYDYIAICTEPPLNIVAIF